MAFPVYRPKSYRFELRMAFLEGSLPIDVRGLDWPTRGRSATSDTILQASEGIYLMQKSTMCKIQQ
jgi:hypothetical protein